MPVAVFSADLVRAEFPQRSLPKGSQVPLHQGRARFIYRISRIQQGMQGPLPYPDHDHNIHIEPLQGAGGIAGAVGMGPVDIGDYLKTAGDRI